MKYNKYIISLILSTSISFNLAYSLAAEASGDNNKNNNPAINEAKDAKIPNPLYNANQPVINKENKIYFVIDAGSSGSRIYIYNKIIEDKSTHIKVLYEDKINTPLAGFADKPETAGTLGVKPLIDNALIFIKATYPTFDISTIKTSVLGTAGMRLISEDLQKKIYLSVSQLILDSKLTLGITQTITGQQEGLYSWADVNYLLDNFKNTDSKPKGIIEVGGASAQIVFVTANSENPNITKVTINGNEYNLFAISYLGLGQDQFRKNIYKDNAATGVNNPLDSCYQTGFSSETPVIKGKFNYNECLEGDNKYLSNKFSIANDINNISDFASQKFVGVGAMYYVFNSYKILDNTDLLENKIKEYCSKDYSKAETGQDNLCFNSIYEQDLLHNLLKFNNDNFVTLNKINESTLTWTLGYLLLND